MTSKYVIISLTIASVAATAFASVESKTVQENTIEIEMELLSKSPGERMIYQVMHHHPIVILSNWFSQA